MSKDYAKKTNQKKKSGASRAKRKKALPTKLIFFTFLLMSSLIALLVYLKWYQPLPVHKTIQSKKISAKKPAIDDDEIPFYKTHEEMLNKTVEIPIEDLKLPDDLNRYVYLMPCGSFRSLNRAEELKAQIAFTGHKSIINKVKVKSGLWYRVELGPFKSKRKTESIRHRLQDNGFNYCKIWRKKIK